MYEKIKYYCDKGIYKNSHLTALLFAKAISQAEYDEILKGAKNGGKC